MFTIRRPRREFLAPLQSTNFLLSPEKKKKRKRKKGRHYFFGFSYRLLVPLELFGAPEAFWRPLELFVPQIFPHHRTLIKPAYGTFLQPNNFFGAPFSWRPPTTPGQPRLRYATGGGVVQNTQCPTNFFVYRTRHPYSIQLVLCVVEEVWSRVTSTDILKEGKGLPQYFID